MRALQEGAIEKLLIYDNLEELRVVLKPADSEEVVVKYLKPEQLKSDKALVDTETGQELDIIENEP